MDELIAWLSDLVSGIVTDATDLQSVADRLAVASSLDAAAFAAEAIDIARIAGESVRVKAHFQFAALLPDFDDETDASAATVLSAIVLALGVGRVTWASRQEARQSRQILIERAHDAYAVASPLGPDLYGWLANLVGVAVRLVSEIAANAAPMVIVESGISLPSTVLAYQMYGDAKRAESLVDIAGASTPLIMPTRFEALSNREG